MTEDRRRRTGNGRPVFGAPVLHLMGLSFFFVEGMVIEENLRVPRAEED